MYILIACLSEIGYDGISNSKTKLARGPPSLCITSAALELWFLKSVFGWGLAKEAHWGLCKTSLDVIFTGLPQSQVSYSVLHVSHSVGHRILFHVLSIAWS